jgi:NADH:ubiquinone oxidoreductase subunit K
MNWARLNCSLIIGILITSISYGLMNHGSKILVQPGIFTEVMLNGALLLIPSGDEYISLPNGSYLVFNVMIYSAVSFGSLFLLKLARTKR